MNAQLPPSTTYQPAVATSSSSSVSDAPIKMEGLVDEFYNMCANGNKTKVELIKYKLKLIILCYICRKDQM